jgi:hypothetical protein
MFGKKKNIVYTEKLFSYMRDSYNHLTRKRTWRDIVDIFEKPSQEG